MLHTQLFFWKLTILGCTTPSLKSRAKCLFSTELGGGGTTRESTVRLAKKGVRNVLIHTGILNAEMEIEPTINLDMPDGDCFVISQHDGLLEPVVDLGGEIKRNEVVARVWPLDRTGVEPIAYRAQRDGMLAGRHFPGLVKSGDCMAVIAIVV